ncbi:phage conserved hypothetical protein, phiE125 gp8 family [Rhodovulum sp. ES.010]|uniref:phage gp6-like head-tail connector protein n=1 Tax=Rhodovulum sp. ES.010 TaxID=1882821 RepID=UPI00092B2FC3|nr:phage gp6-like head-tail connector protein [Rhodovulum sp. ES.010]SIO36538.1 phage conserved hypothetical protein, phiE125 gp8 family [Rhodovulum sp. ES.010]
MKVIGQAPQAVSAAEFKRAVHMGPDDVEDDLRIGACLSAAQDLVEAATRRPMTPREVEFHPRAVGGLRWWFPVAPVSAVSAIAWQEVGGAWADLDAALAWLEAGHDEPQLVLPAGFLDGVADGAALKVTATVGASAVPRHLAEAVILIAKDWYDAGIATEDMVQKRVAFGARRIIQQQRYRRPCEWAAA